MKIIFSSGIEQYQQQSQQWHDNFLNIKTGIDRLISLNLPMTKCFTGIVTINVPDDEKDNAEILQKLIVACRYLNDKSIQMIPHTVSIWH